MRDRQGKARPKKTGNNNDTEAGGVFFFWRWMMGLDDR